MKSIMYGILSSLTIYFLGNFIPKIINFLDSGVEKTFCITIYWLGLFSILVLPQYWIWMTEEDIDLISPLKSMVAFCLSIFAVVFTSIITDKIFVVITLSSTSGMIYAICFWIFALLIMYVPQIFVYEPLRERFGS